MTSLLLRISPEVKAALGTIAKERKQSEYCRAAIERSLVADGAMLPRPDAKAQVIPVITAKRFVVSFRSADGTLNTEQIAVQNERDLFNIYNNIVKIEAL